MSSVQRPAGRSASDSRPEGDDSDELDEFDDDAPARVYTWVHIVALAVVAFVLGMLIVMLVLNDDGQASQQTSGAVEVSINGASGPGLHPLDPTGTL